MNCIDEWNIVASNSNRLPLRRYTELSSDAAPATGTRDWHPRLAATTAANTWRNQSAQLYKTLQRK